MIRDYQAIQKTWFVKGRQKVIQTYGKHEGVKLLGILDYETGKVYVEDHKSYDAQVFMSFLGNVLKKEASVECVGRKIRYGQHLPERGASPS